MSIDIAAAQATAQRLADRQMALKAQAARAIIIEQLSQPGSGRQYGRHRASAPGDSPAVDTGRLRQSIGVQKVAQGHYRVGTNVQYAPLLEFGTRKMAARPFMRPALEKVRALG